MLTFFARRTRSSSQLIRDYRVRLLPVLFLCGIFGGFLLYSSTRTFSVSDNRDAVIGKANTVSEDSLSIKFLEKLIDLQIKNTSKIACKDLQTPLGFCQEPTCPVTFSSSPAERLQQVLATRNGSLGPYLAAMDQSAAPVRPHRIVFASAASDNHYGELQALVHNVRCHVFPRLDNFTFVIYDLGLTPEQRQRTEMLCDCTVLDFPFSSLPAFFRKLDCFTWKPPIINTLLKKSEITVWMDTSVRWMPGAPLDDVFQLLQTRGVLLGMCGVGPIALRTRPSMFKFYGDRACQYHAFPEMYATYGLFHNEPFIRQAVMEPWVSCAFSKDCMCIPNHLAWMTCKHALPRQEGVCHRFDQSSLGIILTKLYLERSHELKMPDGVLDIVRESRKDWFNSKTLSGALRSSWVVRAPHHKYGRQDVANARALP